MSIFKASRLNRIIASARNERVGLVMDYDSNCYTFGGTQQGFPQTLRNHAPIAGYVLGLSGQSGHNGTALPGQGSTDRWSARGTLSNIGSTEGAPSAQESLFPRNGSSLNYIYVPDNAGVTAAGFGMSLYPFSGFDYRQALTIKHYGVSFDNSTGSQGLPYFVRNTNGNAQVGPTQIIEHSANGVGYTTHTFNIAADPARQVLTTYQLLYNITPKVTQPIFLIGISVEATDLDHGWVIMTGLHMGGNSLAENMDDVIKSRQAFQARSNMLAEVVGSGNKVLRIKGIINDGSGRAGAASPARSGIVLAGTTTTITLDDASGISTGDRITTRLAGASGFVGTNPNTTESSVSPGTTQNRIVQTVSENVVTITDTWHTIPVNGDVWRSSPNGSEVPTKEGYKFATSKYMKEFRAIDSSAGLTTTFFDLLQWKREDVVGQTFETQFEPASEELSTEHDDYVGSSPSKWYGSRANVAALSGVDPVHPGSYFLASHLGRAFSESLQVSQTVAEPSANAYLTVYSSTGQNLYAVFRNPAGEVWDGNNFVSFDVANWANYAQGLTEQTSSGNYRTSIPPGAKEADVRVSTGTPSVSDERSAAASNH